MRRSKRSSRRPTRRTGASFCPCLSPNISDDEEGADSWYSRGDDSHRMAVVPRRPPFTEGPSNSQVLSVAREFRSRLAIAADATAQLPESSGLQHFLQNPASAAGEGPYVVHTSVDYTNCLVPALDKIIAAPFYWGVMDRYEAEALLDNKPEGTFLLRDSAQSEYLFSVSFRRYKRTLHARIEQKNHAFSFDFSDTSLFSAKTITDLIAYYNDAAKCLFFEPQLSVPLPRNFVFSLQNLCRARIASLTTYNGVEKLNLPATLRSFVQEYFYKHPVKTINHHATRVDTGLMGRTNHPHYQRTA